MPIYFRVVYSVFMVETGEKSPIDPFSLATDARHARHGPALSAECGSAAAGGAAGRAPSPAAARVV
jgi:hypothetical protein